MSVQVESTHQGKGRQGRPGVMIMAALLLISLGGCQKQEGPAERAGKQVDQAVQEAGKQMEKAGQDIQKAANDAKK